MKTGMIIQIKDGKHKGESGVVIDVMSDGTLRTLTLEGDIHYYDKNGYEKGRPNLTH